MNESSDGGEKKVILRALIHSRDNIIKVIDNGYDIAPNILGRIFKPYVTAKEQGKWTGPGLHVSKEIVEENPRNKLIT